MLGELHLLRKKTGDLAPCTNGLRNGLKNDAIGSEKDDAVYCIREEGEA
jgi:hypothetical protein